VAPDSEAAQPPADLGDAVDRSKPYRHVAADNASEYTQLMPLLARTLLTDLSAAQADERR
jgi:hypothetical protein